MGPALRSLLVVIFSANSRFPRLFKQKKQNCSFPDVRGLLEETKFPLVVVCTLTVRCKTGDCPSGDVYVRHRRGPLSTLN